MTREEALYWLDTIPTIGEQVDALEMAIKALSQEPTIGQLFSCEELEELRSKIWKQVEQQPCDDAISRDMALEKMADYVASGYADSVEDFEEYSRIICQLPSVTQKSGKWKHEQFPNFKVAWFCNKCGGGTYHRTNYCPICGARMVEPQESEVNK